MYVFALQKFSASLIITITRKSKQLFAPASCYYFRWMGRDSL